MKSPRVIQVIESTRWDGVRTYHTLDGQLLAEHDTRQRFTVDEFVALPADPEKRRALAYILTSIGFVLPQSTRPVNRGCRIPPPGWFCSRQPGHEPPCAAHRETLGSLMDRFRRMRGAR